MDEPMSEQLGRIEKSTTERFEGKRKLFLVPIMYEPPSIPDEGKDLLRRYWRQAQAQITNLEAQLGEVKHVYVESVTESGEEALRQVESGFSHTYNLVKEAQLNGAVLEATEDQDTLFQFIDLQRLLMFPLTSAAVADRLQEWHQESMRGRYQHIGQRIADTLEVGEAGLLIINERHQVQFPQDLEVIYVSPPALDEYRRWLSGYVAQQQRQAAETAAGARAEEGGAEEEGPSQRE